MDDEVKEDTKEEKTPEINQEPEKNPTSGSQTTDRKSGADEILSSLKENGTLLNEIKEVIQGRLEYDAVKEKAFDKLYEEMKRQKESFDMLDRAVKPILSDLLLLFDSMKKFELSLTDNQNENNEKISQDFKYVLDELIEILYRQEVIPIEESLSETFNSKIHKATKTENAENKDEDFKITNIVRSGFIWRDKVLRPQEVVIKRFIDKA
jgi:molecular chaperone GrpE (heat shock protein)